MLSGVWALCGDAEAGGPNQVINASETPGSELSPIQGTYPSGQINTAAGAVKGPSAGSFHLPTYSALSK
jgi:hypothetical protein